MLSVMRRAPCLLALCVLSSSTASGCSGHGARAPDAPTSGGDRVQVIVPDPSTRADEDGGSIAGARSTAGAGSATDAGPAADAVLAATCERIEALRSSGEDTPTVTSTDQPLDFLVTRQVITWNTDCTNPVLTIELSDGDCPRGSGHELKISLSVNDVEDGLIHGGLNSVAPESDLGGIRVRYTRPARLRPSGTWGTCSGASGQIVFVETPEIVTRSTLWARYQLMLAPCDGMDHEGEAVYGAFKIQLRQDLSDFCPTRVR
jgi:hypothetical protein